MLQLKIRNLFLIISLLALISMVLVAPIGSINAEINDDDDSDETEEQESEETEEETDDHEEEDNDDGKAKLEKEGKKVLLTSGDFQIEVNAKGQVPFYHFNTSVDDVRFFLKFQRITQFKDENDNSIYDKGEEVGNQNSDLQLPSVDWELVIVTDTDTDKEFIFRSSEIKGQEFEDTTIELINHFSADSSYLKFDINITNWPFEEEATGLCLEFELNWSRGENEGEGMSLKKESDDTSISLKNDDDVLLAYFESASEVEVDGTVVDDGALLYDTASENASKVNILLNYPSFDETLFHDPEIGTSDEALSVSPSTIISWLMETIESVKDGFLVVTALMTFVLATGLIFNRRRQK
ncbi:MAG: hypothetical protein JSW11_16180 [Candidatus Heimdallarchaeota archaeon]|nr:MAG: hypothetical protein JSW11_16180 [Candidatus Heimdallarchaeota archaeon]